MIAYRLWISAQICRLIVFCCAFFAWTISPLAHATAGDDGWQAASSNPGRDEPVDWAPNRNQLRDPAPSQPEPTATPSKRETKIPTTASVQRPLRPVAAPQRPAASVTSAAAPTSNCARDQLCGGFARPTRWRLDARVQLGSAPLAAPQSATDGGRSNSGRLQRPRQHATRTAPVRARARCCATADGKSAAR